MSLKILTENKWWAVVAAVAAIASSAIAVDTRYAKDMELAMVREDLESYKLEQTIDRTQQRIWDTQDRLSVPGLTKKERDDLVQRLRELELMKERHHDQLNKVREQKK